LQPKPPSKRGINRDSFHLFVINERLTLGPIVVDLGNDADVLVDELIINLSLALFHLFYNVQTFLGLCESKSDYI
jgi:hypothetical protein